MDAVVSAIEAGRCSLAVSGALTRDPDVQLALKDLAALLPMALSGPISGALNAVNDKALARAVAQPDGVLVLVEPERNDDPGLQRIATLVREAPHTPAIYVVARSFNPFGLGALTGLKVKHIKGRGKPFLRDLPRPPADLAPVETPSVPRRKSKRAQASDRAPRFVFVGRDEELAELRGYLDDPGPIVISGPSGIGKRTLFEHAVDGAPLMRLPDFVLGRGLGFDALVARLAAFCEAHGAPQLAEVARRGSARPLEIVEAASAALQAVEHDAVLFVEGLHVALSRQGDFFRKSRLEMLLEALLSCPSRLRIVFSTLQQPVLYREGQGVHLRRMTLGGIKGRFLHEIFAAYKAPEFPRERFGPIGEKIGGHPLAARMYAIAVRDRQDGLALTEDGSFLKLEGTTAKLKRLIERKVEKLPKERRAHLATLAHIRAPFDATTIAKLGINRQERLELLALGLLDMTGTQDRRMYRVHPLVRAAMPWRETNQPEIHAALADLLWGRLKSAEGLDGLAMKQVFNLHCVYGRQHRRRAKTPFFDNDTMVDSCVGMIRGKRPHYKLAITRLGEILKAQPGNADAHLLRLEIADPRPATKGHGRAEPPALDFQEVAEEAMEQAPVPEIFHRVVAFWLRRRSRVKAIATLQRAVEALPGEARLRCRLGSILLRDGRRNEAIAQLKEAMALQPMLPDAYGLLGMMKRDEGAAALEEAEELLREAVRLAPEDPVQTARLADLLIDRAATDPDPSTREQAFAEAKELLETSLRGERKSAEAQLALAQLYRRTGGDLDRAEWLLKQARKHAERGGDRHHRIVLERARIELARGHLDEAESMARDQASRHPASHAAYATLAAVLEARQQYIPAHAEYLRAKERAPKDSLWEKAYLAELERLQALIEAQAAGLLQPVATEADEQDERPTPSGNTAHRVIRRPKKADAGDSVSAEPGADMPLDPEADNPVSAETSPEARDDVQPDGPAV